MNSPASHNALARAASGTSTADDRSTGLSIPIVMWRLGTADGAPLLAKLAERIVASYSARGDLIVDVTDGQVLVSACCRGERQHYPASSADPSTFLIGPAMSSPTNPAAIPRIDDPEADAVDASTWFGDDLIGSLVDQVVVADINDGSLMGRISLIVANWPFDGCTAESDYSRIAHLAATSTAAVLRDLGVGGGL
jgi:hypothetical protein